MDTTYALVEALVARCSQALVSNLQPLLNAAAVRVDQETRGYRPPRLLLDGTVVGTEAFSASAVETRLFTDDGSGRVILDDCLTVTAVTRNGAVVSPLRYQLSYDGDANRLPYTELLFRADGGLLGPITSFWYGYPYAGQGPQQIAVTGTWGYCPAAARPPCVATWTLDLAEWAYNTIGRPLAERDLALRNVARERLLLLQEEWQPFRRGGGVRIG